MLPGAAGDTAEPRTRCDAQAATFTSGALSAVVSRDGPWSVDFMAGGRRLTGSPAKGTALIGTDDGRHFIREQLDLGAGDFVYGLGERFGPLVKNGQAVDIWNADGGTSSEQAYKNVPFFLTNAGYGVFVNHPGRVSFEVASEAISRVQFSVEGQAMQYFLIYGPSPKEILRKYTALTGRPARLPAWSFGLWLSTSFTTSYDEATVSSFIDGMAERDLPLHVFHFDTFWMREFNWCDFEWDSRTFPDPRGMLARLKARGLRICVWINPYIAQRSPLFAQGKAKGYLLRRPSGDVWQWDRWQPGMAVVDFTNPEARDWYAAKLSALLDVGVDCFKSDFGERIPVDVAYFDGSDPERMHNYYTYLYNRTVFELLRKHRGEGEAIVFARSATAGSQQFPVHWGGDSESTFEAMGENLRGGLSLGMSGFGYWSHDIGGFEGTPEPALFKRWIAFGLLSSHSRLHGNASYRVPWLLDEEAVHVLRMFTKLKARLMPYLYRRRAAGAHRGRADDARHGAGVPRRSGLHSSRTPVHARRRSAGRAGVPGRRRCVLLRAGRHLDARADRRRGHRAALAPGAALVHERPAAGPAGRGDPGRRGRGPARLRLRRRRHAARLPTGRRGQPDRPDPGRRPAAGPAGFHGDPGRAGHPGGRGRRLGPAPLAGCCWSASTGSAR